MSHPGGHGIGQPPYSRAVRLDPETAILSSAIGMTPRDAIAVSGMTYRQISARSGLSPATLTRLCRGEAAWTPEKLAALATALGVECMVQHPETMQGAGSTPAPGLLTARQAARYLRVSESWLYRHQERIQPVRLGRILRYRQADLDAI